MSANKQEILLHHYIQELTYLRKMGAIFAAQYPKIAARLELDKDECADPHIERLIESVAFLTGRIQYHIDSEFPIFTTALLDILYPQYLQPIPSLTIAEFEIDSTQGQINEGYLIPKHTKLATLETTKGLLGQFRTCYPLTLWPLAISEAQFESTDKYYFLDTRTDVVGVLRLQLSCQSTVTLSDLTKLKQLCIHLNQPWLQAGPLYELLFGEVIEIVLLSNEHRLTLSTKALRPIGFEEDESILPYPPHAHPAYALLQEYFVFPDKFLFFELSQLEQLFERDSTGQFQYLQKEQSTVDILFLLKNIPPPTLVVDKNAFKLGCVPIVNLFTKYSEPLRLDHRQLEYRLAGDLYRERYTEIHSVLKVFASNQDETEVVELQPYFSFRHHAQKNRPRGFWFTRRIPTQRADLTGTDILLSFLDLDFTPELPSYPTTFAQLLCTNRELSRHIQPGTLLQLDDSAPIKGIYTLKHPTIQISPPLEGAAIWRIISHLSLNHLSFTEPTHGLTALQEILRLYNFTQDKAVEKRIIGIRNLKIVRKMGRLGSDAWRGFIRGFKITLEVDKDAYRGSSALVLASVLERFFALYVSANSFTQLILKEVNSAPDDVWKKWPSRPGKQLHL